MYGFQFVALTYVSTNGDNFATYYSFLLARE
jgi:hypothetical protein